MHEASYDARGVCGAHWLVGLIMNVIQGPSWGIAQDRPEIGIFKSNVIKKIRFWAPRAR